ncbi:MAG TPA: HAMP domain-containing sensor histidine kinase [Vicinamibacteria bacterium]|nr:HAMP domain-containing sensor histidine kinase [Vicinamibacteria bacterium]
MFRTLYAKLAVVLLALFLAIGAVYLPLTLMTMQRHNQEVNQKFNGGLAQHLVSETLLMQGGEVNQEVLEDVFHMMMVINPNIEIYLLDPEGKILAFSAPPGTVQRTRVSLDPIQQFLSDSSALPILGDDPRDLSRRKVFTVAPVPLDDVSRRHAPLVSELQGYLYIILGGEGYDSVVEMLQGSYVLRLGAVLGVGSLACALVGSLVLFAFLTRRLRVLTASMARFRRAHAIDADGEGSATTNGNRVDEIDQLTASFEQMGKRITEQVERLKEKDHLRRELIANISHDLRTPLAALHGYLDTLLLKDGQLDVAQRHEYLKTAIKHSERLGHLIYELFELAKLESSDANLHMEAFSLEELLQDVVQKFQLAAEQRNVQLRADLTGDVPFVRADIGLVERVFENLIENAIWHTPERGRVTVTAAPDSGGVRVEVRDTGCGIPESELPRVFDRFYRGEDTASDQPGAGLGLSITRRILELHGSSIEVQSSPGDGAVFTFSLPTMETSRVLSPP